ncbi:MAG: hypothetical protein V3R98_09225, partial [Alphaproteobacteria bacterium]
TGEEPDDAVGANAGASRRASVGETFVDDTAIETAGNSASNALTSNGPAGPQPGLQSGHLDANPFSTEPFDRDDGNAETLDLPTEPDDGATQQVQPNFVDAPILGTSDASGDEDTAIDLADAPTLAANDISGNEDTAIALDITSALADTDGSETLSVVVSGVPTGASLSAGADNGDGTWTLTQAQLSGLTLTPPADSDADFTLTVTSISTDGSDTAQTVDTFDVTVNAVADAPTLAANDVSGSENGSIAVSVSQATLDAATSETTVTVSGVPTGASLSTGTDNGDGTWMLSGDQLADLTYTPPTGSTSTAQLGVSVTDTGGTSTVLSASFDSGSEGFTYVDDAFRGTSHARFESGAWSASGGDSGGGLTTSMGGLNNRDITNGMSSGWQTTFNVPADATGTLTFSYRMTMDSDYESDEYGEVLASLDGQLHGENGNDYLLHVAGDGNGGTDYDSGWQTVTIDLGALSAGDHTLTLGGYNNKKTYNNEVTQVEIDDVSITTDGGIQTLASETVDVAPTTIALDISSALTDTDGSETLAITILDVPDGAILSAGTDNGDGSWSLIGDDLTGLTVTPPAGSSEDFTLTVTATGTEAENDDTFQTVGTFDVTVTGADDQVISGGSAADTIDGGAGDDTISGLAGDDTLTGGTGQDTLSGGSGKDTLYGGTGNDYLDGGKKDDTLYGESGNDQIYGGSGKDTLYGGTGNDYLDGGKKDDTLYGDEGDDILNGGAGNDIAWGADGGDLYIFQEANGNDIFHGGDGGGWTDIIQLQHSDGGAPTDGWTFDLIQGSVVSSGNNQIDLSQDAAGTITMADGSLLTFDGVEKLT